MKLRTLALIGALTFTSGVYASSSIDSMGNLNIKDIKLFEIISMGTLTISDSNINKISASGRISLTNCVSDIAIFEGAIDITRSRFSEIIKCTSNKIRLSGVQATKLIIVNKDHNLEDIHITGDSVVEELEIIGGKTRINLGKGSKINKLINGDMAIINVKGKL